MALGADQVVVVLLAAEPVARLARAVHEDVDDASLAQQAQRPVDRGEPDPGAAARQLSMNLLRGRVVRLVREGGQDRKPLCGRLDPPLPKQGLQIGLPGKPPPAWGTGQVETEIYSNASPAGPPAPRSP